MVEHAEPGGLRRPFHMQSGPNVAFGWCGVASWMLVSQGEGAAIAPQHCGQDFADGRGRRVGASLADQVDAVKSESIVCREHKEPLTPSSQSRRRGERDC